MAKTRTVTETERDRFGNVLASLDRADEVIASDDVYAEVRYSNDSAHWILGRTTSIVVRAGSPSGPVLRSRSGDYDAQGELVAIHVDTGTGVATSTLGYDTFGNLVHVETPPNETGQSQTYDVTFDPEIATYPIATRDGFGYTSTAQYDLRYGA
ncbi:MAG TPA: hypothetical protein VMZ53_03040, partial [Kofleriaceae bacterium]|nr:hypothetical protein [Kofleriaceae bacterium]